MRALENWLGERAKERESCLVCRSGKTDDVKERIRADSAFLTDLCGGALEVDVEVASYNRLTAKNTGEPGPLLMTLKDSSKLEGILREARKLHGCTEFSGIFV